MMDPEKNSAQSTPPYQAPQAQPQSNVGVLNRQYFMSLFGIIRMVLILLSFIGWVSVAASSPCTSTCSSYLFFVIIYFFKSCLILVFFGFGYNYSNIFMFLDKELTLVIHDGVYFILFFAYGIAAAVNENYLATYWYLGFNRGAMAIGSFCAFVCMILCAIDIYLLLKARSNNQSPFGTLNIGRTQNNVSRNENGNFSNLENEN